MPESSAFILIVIVGGAIITILLGAILVMQVLIFLRQSFLAEQYVSLANRQEAVTARAFQVTDIVTSTMTTLISTIREVASVSEVKKSIEAVLAKAGANAAISINGSDVSVSGSIIGGDSKIGNE